MKRAIDFELLVQLAGKGRDLQESSGSGLRVLIERDLDTLKRDAAIDRSAGDTDMGIPISSGVLQLPDRPVRHEPITEPDIGNPIAAGERSDDCIAPDDTLPAGRWAELVSGADRDPVSAEEARAVFHCIRQRLDGVTGSAAEGGNRAPVLPSSREQIHEASDRKIWNEKLDFISTVGQLHAAIEAHFGPSGWTALVLLWHEAAGIQEPTSISTRIPETGRTSPPSPSSLQNEAEALRKLPGAVRRFWLREPPVPPAWRNQESEGERAERQALENLGAWTG